MMGQSRGMKVDFCRYTSVAALEKLGKAYRETTQLFEDYYRVFYKETELAAAGQSVAQEQQCAAMLEKTWLAQPLSEPLHCPFLFCRHDIAMVQCQIDVLIPLSCCLSQESVCDHFEPIACLQLGGR